MNINQKEVRLPMKSIIVMIISLTLITTCILQPPFAEQWDMFILLVPLGMSLVISAYYLCFSFLKKIRKYSLSVYMICGIIVTGVLVWIFKSTLSVSPSFWVLFLFAPLLSGSGCALFGMATHIQNKKKTRWDHI